MKRPGILISIGALALGTVLLSALWVHLTNLTLHHRVIGDGPYNTGDIRKADPW
jgi:hypothetical protein